MRSIEQIIADNGFDNRPAMDTHNLTGRVQCKECRLPARPNDTLCVGHARMMDYDPTGIAHND
jgi:hypothetical protein